MNKFKLGDGTDTITSRARCTMSDVARLAGLSVMTVSRVMNGKDAVSERTRQKVAQAVAALHYTPNQEARSLAGCKPVRIGFLYSNPGAAYLEQFLVGLLNQAGLNNVQLFIEKCDTGAAAQAQAQCMVEYGLDGMILAPPLGDNEALVAHAKAYGIPVVAVACGLADSALGTVGVDDDLAAYDMTRHLISLGHHRIGFVAGAPDQTASVQRLAGHRKAVRELGADTSDELIVRGQLTYRSGLDAAGQILALTERPTAIFASNDDMAAAVVAVAQRIGIDVPGDLTVTGFDDTALATRVWPELTTIRQPIADMARKAVEMVVRRIRARHRGEVAMPEHVRLGWELVRRQSDAVPRMRPPLMARGDMASPDHGTRPAGGSTRQAEIRIRPSGRSSANTVVTQEEAKPVHQARGPT